LSVVIPVRNGSRTLGEQLNALAEAVRPPGGFEVLVADNGSTDGTADVARSYSDRLPVRLVDASARPGSNYARNRGIAESRFGRILLCDSDDRVDVAWLAAMAAAFDEGEELIAGPIDYLMLNPRHVRDWRGADRASTETVMGFLPTGHGANLGFTRALYDHLGGFDDEFEFGGDDVEFCWRAQFAGARLRSVPEAIVHYRIRPSMPALFRQSMAYGAAEAHLYTKFAARGMSRRPVQALLREMWWLASRLPLATSPGRRGAWLRRLGQQLGRFRGAFRYRVWWW
jgi:glycosyltransferase involved in cell wall biosynthesis